MRQKSVQDRAPAEAVLEEYPESLIVDELPNESIVDHEPKGSTMSGQARWISSLPGLCTLCRYEAAWLSHDIVAGLILTTMLGAVGIAYAVASGLPGINGLYATVPLLVYALSGPSRILLSGSTRRHLGP
jgi:hypothetical protein